MQSKLAPEAITSIFFEQYKKVVAASSIATPEQELLFLSLKTMCISGVAISFFEDSLKIHKIQHLYTKHEMYNLNIAFEAIKTDHNTDFEARLPVTAMSQVNARLRQDIDTNRNIGNLEVGVGKIEQSQGIMATQIQL